MSEQVFPNIFPCEKPVRRGVHPLKTFTATLATFFYLIKRFRSRQKSYKTVRNDTHKGCTMSSETQDTTSTTVTALPKDWVEDFEPEPTENDESTDQKDPPTTPTKPKSDRIKLTSDQILEVRRLQVQERMLTLTENVYGMRREWLLRQNEQKSRDLEQECYVPKEPLDCHQLYRLHLDNGIARRVNEVMAKETWQVQPCVYEDEDPNVLTPFEEDYYGLSRQLRGESCFHQDEEGSALWEHVQRADILSGIGRYGIIFLGLDDGKSPDQPATYQPGQKLLFMREFPEHLCPIDTVETNWNSHRFGQPLTYNLRIADVDDDNATSEFGLPSEVKVHWTRVIHLADNRMSSELYGIPRTRPVCPYIYGVQKLYLCSPEMYYKGAFPGLSFETHPSLGTDAELDVDKIKENVEAYYEGLKRYLASVGGSWKSIAPQVVDPTPQIMAELQAICIQIGVPMRIFLGSERGELASSQDDETWNDRIKGRQYGYTTPNVICPLLDRLIYLGVLRKPSQGSRRKTMKVRRAGVRQRPMPVSNELYTSTSGQEKVFTSGAGYSASWPDLSSQTKQERSASALQNTQALVQYVSGGAEMSVDFLDFLVFWLGMPEDEAKAVVANATKEGRKLLTQKMIDKATEPRPAPGQMSQGRQGGKGGKTVSAQSKKSPLASQRTGGRSADTRG